MVDSSVGGKTAIDTPHGKNLIGSFWQPEYVFIDGSFLETLPAREFSNGMAEVVKTAVIWDEKEFELLEANAESIIAATHQRSSPSDSTLTNSQKLLMSVIIGSISVKAHIVTIDERETGLRNLVNFGHSIGHAIEAVLTPTILHGECVSIGMILEAEIARALGHLSQVAIGRLVRSLKAYALPISVTDSRISSLPVAELLSVERLLDIMQIDKKNSGSTKKIVLLSRIGATLEPKATGVDDEVIRLVLSQTVRVVAGVPRSPVIMTPPGSKSISNRALVLAALGQGVCRIKNLLHSDDTQVMMTALLQLKGASFSWEDNGETLVVDGGAGKLSAPQKGQEIYLGNAGTASRFLTTVCTLAQSAEDGVDTVITGNARMKQRPIGPLVDALRLSGSNISYLGTEGSLPLSIQATRSGFMGSKIQLTASVSSQYVSSILLCAPYASEPVTLELVGGQVISQPYIDMTIAIMKSFGVDVLRERDPLSSELLNIYHVPRATYVNPSEYVVESDASSATYPLAVAAITGTTCTISNVGASSLQGDAYFAKGVLEPMGCTVVQTASETTVTGPPTGQLRALGNVDMETMTDAFLTASVLAAVATQPCLEGRVVPGSPPTTTRIYGIANQRVKECNRIKAMIDQLAKFGVETREFDDGLEIIGKPLPNLRSNVSVHCYDDHRIAMSFSVLGTVVRGTILEEKRCVEKTWPNWWDDLSSKIGINVEGVDLLASASTSSTLSSLLVDTSLSVVLIGMRGAGKTFVGGLAADALGRAFVDADVVFAEKQGMPLSTFVAENGWAAFRQAELQILKDLLSTMRSGCVISLGGGVVETPDCRELLKTFVADGGAVVHVIRDLEEIETYLGEEQARPAWGEPFKEVAKRRGLLFADVASHEFFNYTKVLRPRSSIPWTEQGLGPAYPTRTIRDEVVRFFGHITGAQTNFAANLGVPGKRSYFVCLTYPDVNASAPDIDQIADGADAIELRVDLLNLNGTPVTQPNVPSRSYVASQLAALRQLSALPVVFTVRTVSQGGYFPDDARDEAFDLLELALKSGCEYIDLEITWNIRNLREFVGRKGRSKIIASFHDWTGHLKWDSSQIREKHNLASALGDIVKIVSKASSMEDNFALHRFQSQISAHVNAKPLIAINMGQEGQLSRILNPNFSPLFHPLMPVSAAPGQLSFVDIQRALHLIGQLPAQKYYLFGTPITHSQSPTLHNTGFQTLGLPHHYELLETTSVDNTLKQTMLQPDFGGASVTIPHKLTIIPLLSRLSTHAKVIGAVNTVIPVENNGRRELVGENTDWRAIRDLVAFNLTRALSTSTTALIIGAGGTSRAAVYALRQLDFKTIYIFNRTKATAQSLAESFPSEYNIIVLDRLDHFPALPPSVIISTVPASATSLVESSTAILLPKTIFGSVDGGVVIDMAYKPVLTPLLELASAVNHDLSLIERAPPPPGEMNPPPPKWVRLPGISVLLEQGYQQFELWTGRRAPRDAIQKAVWNRYSAS